MTELGQYRLLRRIGVGGMAELFVAVARGAGSFAKPVAIKRILPNLAQESEFISMFFEEARLAASLDHPYIAKVLDFGDDGGLPYIVMEFVHGVDLRGLLAAASGAFPAEVAATVTAHLAEALHHVHEQRDIITGKPLGLVHRDVSPSNVLIGYSGGLKLTDFGIAKATGATAYTATGALKGKLAYLSPEQARCERIDRRTDIYAMGLVLYELLTGRRMHRALSEVGLLARVCDGEYTSPTSLVPELDPELEAITRRCLEPAIGDRYTTAREVAGALEVLATRRQWTLSIGTLDQFVAANITDPGPVVLNTMPGGLSAASTIPGSATELGSLAKRPSRGRQIAIASALLGIGIGIGLGPSLASRGAEESPAPESPESLEHVDPPATVMSATPAPEPTPSELEGSGGEPSEPERIVEPPATTPDTASSKRKRRPSKTKRSARRSTSKSKPAPSLHNTLRPPSQRD